MSIQKNIYIILSITISSKSVINVFIPEFKGFVITPNTLRVSINISRIVQEHVCSLLQILPTSFSPWSRYPLQLLSFLSVSSSVPPQSSSVYIN